MHSSPCVLGDQSGCDVGPWADREVCVAARVTKSAEVAELTRQEEVVPAGDEVDRRLDVRHAGLEDLAVPVGMGRIVVREPVLIVAQIPSELRVGDCERPGVKCPAQPSADEYSA
jgi:hypothetical protein